jgi:hypothetical protein
MNRHELTIAFCGDVMMGCEVGQYMGTSTLVEWLSDISAAWRDADLLIGNLECPCVVNAKPVDSPTPELIFHAPAYRLKEMADAGFTALTLANNHIFNCGVSGLSETIQGLERAGLYHAGAGMSLAEALRPAFIPVKGKTVALIAFCYASPAGKQTPGVAPLKPKMMRQALAHARNNSDVVIAAVHDGLEYSDVPPSKVRAGFRFLADNGADIVIGHHPHVLQGIEWRGNVPIAYSLGDLLFTNSLPHVSARNFRRIAMGRYAPHEIRRDPDKFARGAILTIGLSGTTKTVRWAPFRQRGDLRPELAVGPARAAALQHLDDLTAALLNPDDPRHALADEVMELARREQLATLSLREVLRIAVRPQARHLRSALPWIYHRARRRFVLR